MLLKLNNIFLIFFCNSLSKYGYFKKSIRVAFIIVVIVISYLCSKCVVDLSESVINIINNLI